MLLRSGTKVRNDLGDQYSTSSTVNPSQIASQTNQSIVTSSQNSATRERSSAGMATQRQSRSLTVAGDGASQRNGPGNGPIQQTANTGGSSGRGRDANLRPHNKYVVGAMKVFFFSLIMMYFIVPAFIRLNPWIIKEVLFLNRFRWPPFVNLSNPAEVGLNHTRHFQILSPSGEELGAWHVLPADFGVVLERDYTSSLAKGNPVILYLHGNAGTRAGWHRVQLYKLLAKSSFHVITIDYRGFGDSPGTPSEEGVCEDALAAFFWIKQHSANSPVYIWGHSLGSGVATKTAGKIAELGLTLDGLVLEAPFNNMLEVATLHPFSKPFSFMPWFTWVFLEAIKTNNVLFASEISIAHVIAPTLILHAEDDAIVPIALGRKLYETAVATKQKGGVQFQVFPGTFNYGHKHIHKAPDLPDIIRKFMSSSSQS